MNTKHSNTCNAAFGRKDGTCPRCIELLNGAAPRAGWQKAYYSSNKARQDAQFIEALRTHDCKTARCSLICTFGDW